MSIRIGVYEFFAHLIGGSFLFAAILYLLQKLLPIPLNVTNLSTTQFLIAGTIAYVIGYATTPMSSVWYHLWVPKDLYQKTVNDLKKELPIMEANLQDMDWYTLIAFIKRYSIEMAQDIEQYNAISIMLRSTSIGFLLFSIIFCFEFLIGSRLHGHIVLSILCLFFSIILVRESVRFHTYFFRSIYQSVIALIIKPEQLSVKIRQQPAVAKE